MLIGVVAHVDREELATRLIDDVGADVFRFDHTFPPDITGCAHNHIQVLKDLDKIATDGEWCVVLEDDARPVEDFRDNLKRALQVLSNDQALVGLHLVTGNPNGATQLAIEPAIKAAEASDSHWIVADWFISTVGYVVRSGWLSGLITAISSLTGPVDNRINTWTHRQQIHTWYTNPSLVDHDDQSSLLTSFMPHPRHAHRLGTRDKWTTTTTVMDTYVQGWSPDA